MREKKMIDIFARLPTAIAGLIEGAKNLRSLWKSGTDEIVKNSGESRKAEQLT